MTGIRIASGGEFIEAAVADAKASGGLGVAVGCPLLMVRRRTSLIADGEAVEDVITHYRADRYRFKVSLDCL